MINTQNSIVIFGAGKYGKMALEHFGRENVGCFIDNCPEKYPEGCMGKQVLSLADYLENHAEKKIVIAVNSFASIAEQLREKGINDYDFYNPYLEDKMSAIEMAVREHKGTVYILGTDDKTEIILKRVQNASEEGSDFIVCEKDDRNLKEASACLKDILWIVGAPGRAYALQLYFERIFPGQKLINPFVQESYIIPGRFIVNAYEDGTDFSSDEDAVNTGRMNGDKEKIDEYMDELDRSHVLFNHIELETINRCNGVCDFCPVSVGHDTREKKLMDEGLFKSVVDQLAELEYSGKFAPFSNNEPFLDKRIVSLTKYAREKLSNARFHIFTNGTLLTVDVFKEIMKYLDEMFIDNYSMDLKLIPSVKKIADYCEKNEDIKKRVSICIRRPNEIRTSRGGDAPNRKRQEIIPEVGCVLPFRQMIVRPDGKVSLCCNDPYGKYTLGDLTKESLEDIWFGEKFTSVRSALRKGRRNWGDCRYCDTVLY